MPGDPTDIEELEIFSEYTYKHRMSIEMEDAIKLVFYQNQLSETRKQVIDDLFDYGVAGYKDWIDSNGAVRVRRVNPENLIVGYSDKKNF